MFIGAILVWLASVAAHVTWYGELLILRFGEGYLGVYWNIGAHAVYNNHCSPYWHPDEPRRGTVADFPEEMRWDVYAPCGLFNPWWWRAVPNDWAILGPKLFLRITLQRRLGLWPPVVHFHRNENCVLLPIWTFVVGSAIPLAVGRWRRRGVRFPPGHCRRCGYDLTGNVSGRCPECGEDVRSQRAG